MRRGESRSIAGGRGAARRGPRRVCFAAALAGALAACAAPEPVSAERAAAVAPSAGASLPALPPGIVRAVARPRDLPRFAGLSGRAVVAAPGPPDFLRRDGPAEV